MYQCSSRPSTPFLKFHSPTVRASDHGMKGFTRRCACGASGVPLATMKTLSLSTAPP